MEQPAPNRAADLSPLQKAMLCARAAAEHKAEKTLIYEVAQIASFTDYFVICSGRSTRHVHSIAEHIEEELGRRRLKPMGVEGLTEGHWVLLDYSDVIIHIFYQPMRDFYDLEGLWWEARQVEFSDSKSPD
jgi:ribosome-associated protein